MNLGSSMAFLNDPCKTLLVCQVKLSGKQLKAWKEGAGCPRHLSGWAAPSHVSSPLCAEPVPAVPSPSSGSGPVAYQEESGAARTGFGTTGNSKEPYPGRETPRTHTRSSAARGCCLLWWPHLEERLQQALSGRPEGGNPFLKNLR